jgi:hypothetical protein
MIKKTIYCEQKDCGATATEKHEGAGFPNWGEVLGFDARDDDGRGLSVTVCPKCKSKILEFLKNGFLD